MFRKTLTFSKYFIWKYRTGHSFCCIIVTGFKNNIIDSRTNFSTTSLISNIQPKSSQNCLVLLLLSFSLYLSYFLICLLFTLMFLFICFLCFSFHILINFLVLDIDPSITFYFFVEFTIIFTCFTSCIPYGIFVN